MPEDDVSDPSQTIAVLRRELAQSRAERDEALARETATPEVLGIINSSPGDLVRAFDAILEKALRLCEASFGALATFDGIGFRMTVSRGYEPGAIRSVQMSPPSPGTAFYRLIHGTSRTLQPMKCTGRATQIAVASPTSLVLALQSG